MFRIPSASTDQKVPFTAVDVTDGVTYETGLSGFTVYRCREGGTPVLWTTPTITEVDATNCPGEYWLTMDEDTTIGATHDDEIMTLTINHASMRQVKLALNLYRQIADVVWDEDATAHQGGGTFGLALGDPGLGGASLIDRIGTPNVDVSIDIAVLDNKIDTILTNLSDVENGVSNLNNLSAAEVKAEVVDALATDTYAEPAGVPGATVSLAEKIGRLYQMARNKIEVTASAKLFYDDAGVALWKKTLADDTTTYSETEGVAP